MHKLKPLKAVVLHFPAQTSTYCMQPLIPIPISLTEENQTNTQVFPIFLLNTKLTNSVVSVGEKKGHIALFMVTQNHAAVPVSVH